MGILYQNLTWVATPGVLQHFDSNFCTFISFLLTTSRRIQKGAGFNKRAGRIVSSKINKRAGSNKAVQGDKGFSKRINEHSRLLETQEY